MKNITVLDHPVIKHKISILRDTYKEEKIKNILR